MDLSPLISQMFNTFWILIPVVILISLFKSAWFKGKTGDFIVNLFLNLFLSKDEYHLLKNITLKSGNGTTQIDHIIVSKYGIFVIETKNMKGWIFGSENQRNWTQKIYKYTNQFQNPLRQNYKHVKTLEDCLNLKQNVIYSIIVFTGDATFKTNMPDNVTYAFGCIKYIKRKNNIIFHDEEVTRIVDEINQHKLEKGWQTNRQHISNIKNSSNSNTCRKCGSEMVVRTARRGKNSGSKFLGCSTYPKCKWTTNYDL